MAEDVKVKFGGDFTGIAQGAASAGKIAGTAISSSFHEYTKGLTSSIANMFSVTNIMGKLFEGVKDAFKYFREIDELSRQLNVSREDLQRFGKVGASMGISMEAMGKSIQFANKTIGAAMISTGKQRDTLIELGFTEKEITDGRVKSIDVMMKLAGEYDKHVNTNVIAKHTTEMFGRSGGQLNKILEQGTALLKERIATMKIFSESEVRAAAAADRMYELGVKAAQRPFKDAAAGFGLMGSRILGNRAFNEEVGKEYGTNFLGYAKMPNKEDVKPESVQRIAEGMRINALKNNLKPEDYLRALLNPDTLSATGGYGGIAAKVASRLQMMELEEQYNKEQGGKMQGPQLETAVVSSLQSIGGGDLARVTNGLSADSIEDNTRRTADAVEKIAGKNDTPEIPQKDLNKAR
jgi:hypothetical protein